MSKNKALGKNYGALTIIQASNFLLPFLTLPFIVRTIGPERFGAINFSIAIVTYFILFINFGFDFTATRRVAQNREDKQMINELFSQIFYSRILLFIVSVLVFAIMFSTIPQMNRHPIVSMFIFASCLANVFTPNWLFQGLQIIHKTALFNFLSKLVFCVSIVFLIRKPDDYIWYAVMSASSQVVVAIALFIYAIRKFNVQFRVPDYREVFNLLKEDKMVFIATLMISFYTTSNTVILGLLTTEKEVGIFTAASRVIAVVQSVMLLPMSQALFPHIGTAFSKGKEEGVNEVKRIFPLVMMYTFTMCFLAALFAPLVVHILYGSKFEDSIWILRILAISPFVASISNVMGVQTLLNLKMDKVYFRVTIIGCIFNISLNLLLIPLYSYYGTAIAWVGTELSVMLTLFIVLRGQRINLIDRNYFSLAYLKQMKQTAFKSFRKG
ncbi:flippase [Pedobacter sp. AW31-3R]|uniref:flippase n=1 Tax=Pedobacter sp. AW31-3R TaxID=3445781 RepID=UPI003F9F3427